ncbi:lamin tail domain-containing protein 1 [Psammomys obesus]|uniref:lamin tail domain-containing protein 1 n=1 Tax=Psammomys obesus TaxID=48139 RepID=UPI0024531E09|nr:lamin tail domain-containing protein 1 [Psammomys obesus]XP_055461613.1 lamin tail domain-containing protein 1 [Psammomys obesus]
MAAEMKEGSESPAGDMEDISDTDINKQDNNMQKEQKKEEKSEILSSEKKQTSVHFTPTIMASDSSVTLLSRSLSQELPLGTCHIASHTSSPLGPRISKSTLLSCSPGDLSLDKPCVTITPLMKEQCQVNFDSDTFVLGDGEDYFLSLFQESKKLTPRPSQTDNVNKHLSVILEEVGQFTSSFLGDIKIAEVNVKGLFVRLVNTSTDKEVEISNHILQQNMKGQAVSVYRFLPNIVMQANCMVTVWAAESEAKPQPPTDFVWEEQSRFRTSPDCTTILCNPQGEAIAWYTPIHWKQAWEKLETDIEFERCSAVIPSLKSHMFGWTTAATSSISKEKQEPTKKDLSPGLEQVHILSRELEIPPSIFPTRSPWCNSPSTPPHPYCSLINSQDTLVSRWGAQPKPQAAKKEAAPGTKKKKSKSEGKRK